MRGDRLEVRSGVAAPCGDVVRMDPQEDPRVPGPGQAGQPGRQAPAQAPQTTPARSAGKGRNRSDIAASSSGPSGLTAGVADVEVRGLAHVPSIAFQG